MSASSPLRRRFAPFARLTDFAGRTRRADYWPFMLVLIALYAGGFILTLAAFATGPGPGIAPGYAVIALIALLAFAATVRRLHDVGWSGWWAGTCLALLLGFVGFSFYWRYGIVPRLAPGEPSLFRFMPILMIVNLAMTGLGLLILVLAVLDGNPGPNRYGPDPKGRTRP